jgi:hypothetical protein
MPTAGSQQRQPGLGYTLLAMSCPSILPGEVPQRSAQQRREALAHANRVRFQRALLKADLKRGNHSIANLIADPPEYLASAKVLEVLTALPRYGRMRATGLLERCRVSPKKSIGGLSERQRRELIRALKE